MIGTQLAHFLVTAHLGSGGMGEVYQAVDSKLGRQVAIKLLPEDFTCDRERVVRFEHEARVLASLNHPNIASIYGLEHVGGRSFLVMELVDGLTLAELIRKGPTPVSQALDLAKQIAEAMEAAHDKGVVHRDLKPANIKITSEGKVKVLDFGLAKGYRADDANADLSNASTLLSALIPGTILGTPAYMSPEQAKGQEVDQRADIFAFGCILFEMLSAKRAFDGENVSEIIARVIEREPEWSLLPPAVPSRMRELLQLCLEKNAKNRRSSAADVRLDLELTQKEPSSASPIAPVAAIRSGKMVWLVASVMMAMVVLLAAMRFNGKMPDTAEMRLEISTPTTHTPFEFALSPNGKSIVFVASGAGLQRLWLRALDKTEAEPMAGTEGANFPFWSPDGRSIGFFTESKLKRIDLNGGPPMTIAEAVAGQGGSWNADGTIIFASQFMSPLSRIAVAGGQPVSLTQLDPPHQTGHAFPQFLPDGRHFLFYVTGTPEDSGVYLGSLDGKSKRLTAADTAATYLEADAPNRDGRTMILFMRQTALVAQHLDLQRQELTGDPFVIADPVGAGVLSSGAFSVSTSGRIAYRASGGARQLTWFDRTGRAVGVAGERDSKNLLHPELSPDGGRVAVQRQIQNNMDIWLIDLLRGSLNRFTVDPAIDAIPLWSPDGSQIVFASNRTGVFNLYVKASNMAGAEQLLLDTPNLKLTQDWSNDGRFVLYYEVDPKSEADLWALPVGGTPAKPSGKPIVVVNSPSEERNGQFSPDGKWVAYETDEPGRFEVFVQRFPVPTGRWQVSTVGGVQPRWRADGKELYFIDPEANLMAVSIASSGSGLLVGKPIALLATRLPGSVAARPQYAVSRDGKFLLDQQVESAADAPITLILNWSPKLKN